MRMRQKGMDWYLSNVAAGFWVHRVIDNTEEIFLKILTEVLTHCEEGFVD